MRAANQQDSRRCLAILYKRMSENDAWQLSTACAADQELSGVSAALMAGLHKTEKTARHTEGASA